MFGTKKKTTSKKNNSREADVDERASAKAFRPVCGQRPKGLRGPICTRKVRSGWNTCGRPDCATWKFCEADDEDD